MYFVAWILKPENPNIYLVSWVVLAEKVLDKFGGKFIIRGGNQVTKEGNEYIGYRPVFSEKIRKLDSQVILVQGYMFPLEQDDEQSLFLLGPFPLSCPYHPQTQSNLLIEVHAKKPILFSYDAVNIEGKLELVPKDDDYNVFFRLKEAKQIQ